MGGEKCPNCEHGILVHSTRGTKRCRICGKTKYDSPNKRGRTVEGMIKEEKKESEIPTIEEEPSKKRRRGAIPKGEGYSTNEYKDQKWLHDQQIKLRNRQIGIQRMLEKLRKANKYSGIKEVEIEGELWDVETGQPVREKEKVEKTTEEEFTPDRIIEEMVEEQS